LITPGIEVQLNWIFCGATAAPFAGVIRYGTSEVWNVDAEVVYPLAVNVQSVA
jgi:hypothetical protein